jgi:hypothetical protein
MAVLGCFRKGGGWITGHNCRREGRESRALNLANSEGVIFCHPGAGGIETVLCPGVDAV